LGVTKFSTSAFSSGGSGSLEATFLPPFPGPLFAAMLKKEPDEPVKQVGQREHPFLVRILVGQ